MNVIFIILLGVLPLSNSTATSFSEQPFPDAVSEAPIVLRGKIGSSYTNWGESQSIGRRIFTFYEIQVDEVFKGKVASGNPLIMRELGGVKDGVGMEVAGTAQFKKDEDVVVFLGAVNSDGSHDVYGMMMGKFNIAKDDEGNEYLEGAGISSTTHPALRHYDHVIQKGEKPKKWTLDSLRKLVQSQVHAQDSSLPNVITSASPIKGSPAFSPTPPGTDSSDSSPALKSPNSNESTALSSKWFYGIGIGGIILAFWYLRKIFF